MISEDDGDDDPTYSRRTDLSNDKFLLIDNWVTVPEPLPTVSAASLQPAACSALAQVVKLSSSDFAR